MKRRILIIFSALLLPMAVLAVSTQAAQGAPPEKPALAWSPSGTFDFGSLTSGQTSQTFTLTNSGGTVSGLTVMLKAARKSTGFTKTEDTCSGPAVTLATGASCSVTVQYAFTAAGQTDSATLTAKRGSISATVALTGKSESGPNLTISAPATFTGRSGTTNNYSYDFGTSAPKENFQAFDLTNSGPTAVEVGDVYVYPGSSEGGPFGYVWSNWSPTCTGANLAPGQSCTFRVEFAGTGICPYPEPTGVSSLDYKAESSDRNTVYAHLHVTFRFVCGSP